MRISAAAVRGVAGAFLVAGLLLLTGIARGNQAAPEPATVSPAVTPTPMTEAPPRIPTERDASAPVAPPAPAIPPSAPPASADFARYWPLVILALGIATVLGLIIVFKVNAFLALIAAAILVSLLSEGDWPIKIARVAAAFGSAAGSIGIVIALAAIIGDCMLRSGAADRIVRVFLSIFGVERAGFSLMLSGFILSIPVFFDTVFYLLIPLARSMYRTTGRNYLLYVLAIGAGGAATHTLVPPTPGPLLIASNLGFDVGMMILMGTIIAFPSALAALGFAWYMDSVMPVEMRTVGVDPEPKPLDEHELPPFWIAVLPVILPVILISGDTIITTIADNEHAALLAPGDVTNWATLQQTLIAEQAAAEDTPGKRLLSRLPEEERTLLLGGGPLSAADDERLRAEINARVLGDKEYYQDEAFLGIKLNKTARDLIGRDKLRMKKSDVERKNRAILEGTYPQLVKPHDWDRPWRQAAGWSALFGDANLALLLSAVIAILMVAYQRAMSKEEIAKLCEDSLMSAGVIILITSGGGAFGAMLGVAKVGPAIQALFAVDASAKGAGLMFLVLGFIIAAVLKVAQGSTTVAMITASSMLAGVASPAILGCHPVYLATCIGAGGLMGSWMNDSGFWIIAKMSGLTEGETLRTWTLMLVVLGGVAFGTSLLMAWLLPLV